MTSNRRDGRTTLAGAAFAAALTMVSTTAFAQAASDPPAPAVVIEDDGTVRVPPISVPVSRFLTPQGKAYLTRHLQNMQDPRSKMLPDDGVPFFLKPYLESARAQFALDRADIVIAGVKGLSFTPKGGIASGKRDKILINLHGGGFMMCYPACGEMESMPIAALGGYKVITIDYRQSPQHRFPAASEDVAAVYRELLKTYKPENVGIYGCSAGGMLVGMALAWFDKEKLPMPGGAGIFCAGLTLSDGAGFGGDADFVVAPIGEANLPAEPPPPLGKGLPPLPYFAGVDITNPLAAPANSPALLAKFPPTLFITGTRAFELSSAVYSHGQLVKAGAKSDLHVWDGLFHGFFMNPDVPESRDAFKVIVNFFDANLGAAR
ncbi:alpha/beta hydrolase [Sphingomonas hengshuiensis]|uniref:Alpha/beta hydrolase n=1 Tax=Sphingomonas hengshuiensis TaxID=1609977 RepID=A0A7U4J977_9SPHN|nr:alpha/beta hydrolase [Sphingomonas hengshuiensis]AJP72533.1 alpha/beta hydrolase [Sphingomonas hengshuiensis]